MSEEIEDIFKNLNKKERRKNTSKRQGNRGENNLADVLNKRFPGQSFYRVLGSGNRWSQVKLNEEAMAFFTADLNTPPNFVFAIECKYGYADIDLCTAFPNGHKQIDEWLVKIKRDGDRVKKRPLLCWKKPYKPWLAFLQHIPEGCGNSFQYNTWNIVALDKLLEQPDSFWFSTS